MILPSEKLSRITSFGAKFIFLHQQYKNFGRRYFGDHHINTLWLSLNLNSLFILFLKLQSNVIMIY